MATRAITLLLLSFAFNKAYCSPVPQCPGTPVPPPTPCSGTPTTPGPVEYNQNNGQPVVIYAFNDASNEVSQPIAPVLPATPCSNPGPITVPAPAPAPVPAPEPSDLENAQSIADQSVNEQGLETIPAPDQPCKVETSTEIVQAPGETFVHQPGEILINQPPTRLIINHAPYIVRPSAVVVNQGGKKITNEYTRKILPSAIQLRPIIVRIVKPIEKKVLIDKPQQPGCQNYAQTPVIPDQCATALASASSTAPVAYAPVSYPTASVDSTDYSALLAQAGYGTPLSEGSPVEIQTDNGPALTSVPIVASPGGCGCV